MIDDSTMYKIAIPLFKVALAIALIGIILGHYDHILTAAIYAILLAFLVKERNAEERKDTPTNN